jgi:hypothetical protein
MDVFAHNYFGDNAPLVGQSPASLGNRSASSLTDFSLRVVLSL